MSRAPYEHDIPSLHLTRINTETGFQLTFTPLRVSCAPASSYAPPGKVNILLDPWISNLRSPTQSEEDAEESGPNLKNLSRLEMIPDFVLCTRLLPPCKNPLGSQVPPRWKGRLKILALSEALGGWLSQCLADQGNERMSVEELRAGSQWMHVEEFHGEGWVLRLEIVYLPAATAWKRMFSNTWLWKYAIGLRFKTYFMAETPVREHTYQVMYIPYGVLPKPVTEYLFQFDCGKSGPNRGTVDLVLHQFNELQHNWITAVDMRAQVCGLPGLLGLIRAGVKIGKVVGVSYPNGSVNESGVTERSAGIVKLWGRAEVEDAFAKELRKKVQTVKGIENTKEGNVTVWDLREHEGRECIY